MAMMGSGGAAGRKDAISGMFEVLADPAAYQEKWEALEKKALEVEERFAAAAGGISDVQAAAQLRAEAEETSREASRDRLTAAKMIKDAEERIAVADAAHRANVARWESDLNDQKAAIVADARIADEAGKAAQVLLRQAEALMQEADARDAETREMRERVEAKIRAYEEAGQ